MLKAFSFFRVLTTVMVYCYGVLLWCNGARSCINTRGLVSLRQIFVFVQIYLSHQRFIFIETIFKVDLYKTNINSFQSNISLFHNYSSGII